MESTICCGDCGRIIKENDGVTGNEAVCPKCGSKIEYHTQGNMCSVRLITYASMVFPDQKRMFKLCCPNCGRRIGNSADGTDTEIVCAKCKSTIHYKILHDTAYIQLTDVPKGQYHDED